MPTQPFPTCAIRAIILLIPTRDQSKRVDLLRDYIRFSRLCHLKQTLSTKQGKEVVFIA